MQMQSFLKLGGGRVAARIEMPGNLVQVVALTLKFTHKGGKSLNGRQRHRPRPAPASWLLVAERMPTESRQVAVTTRLRITKC